MRPAAFGEHCLSPPPNTYPCRVRSEWIPVSASALITGAMALVLAQMLNPMGSDNSPVKQLEIAADSPNRWLAMSILFFIAAVGLVLGMPSVMVLFTGRRGRALGMLGVGVLTLGCMGVAGLSAMMLFFRSLALEGTLKASEVTAVVEEPGMVVMLNVYVYGFLGGVLIIAAALFRAKQTPVWVPILLVAFLAIQPLIPLAGPVLSAVGLMTLAAGFTGIATSANTPARRAVVARSYA